MTESVREFRQRQLRRHIREIVTLRFAKVDVSYSAQKGDGSLDTPTQFRYDIEANPDDVLTSAGSESPG